MLWHWRPRRLASGEASGASPIFFTLLIASLVILAPTRVRVRVFAWDPVETWVQRGEDIDG